MTVKEITPNILVLEFRQEHSSAEFGGCLWARFYFNLDRFELLIESDCGAYGYKWVETKETFLHLMARCEGCYILNKISQADIFDYEATKKNIIDNYFSNDDDIHDIFKKIEDAYEPENMSALISELDDNYIITDDLWTYAEYRYPLNAVTICNVFEKAIRPRIQEILGRSK